MRLSPILILIVVLLPLNSCIVNQNLKDVEVIEDDGGGSSNNGHNTDSEESGSEEFVADTSVKIKNFNQLNMTFSKLTGIHRGEEVISETMTSILNQLPANNKMSSFNAFQQISIIRLAFEYCNLYVEDNSDFSTFLATSPTDEQIADRLIFNFLPPEMEDNPEQYNVLKDELVSTLKNEASSDDVAVFIENSPTTLKLTKMSCTLVLSSSFLTLI